MDLTGLTHRSNPPKATDRFALMATSCASQPQLSADLTMVNQILSCPTTSARNAALNGNTNRWAEERKVAIYLQISPQVSCDFFIFSIEVHGCFGKQADALLKSLASQAIHNMADVDFITANKLHASLL